jgi:hypothetical protein
MWVASRAACLEKIKKQQKSCHPDRPFFKSSDDDAPEYEDIALPT